MEKVKTIQKTKIFSSRKAIHITGTILLSGIGIALPRIFHILAGSSAGAIFLPMHIVVLIASLVFGALSGSIVGVVSVIGSYLLTGMPAIARLPYMIIELAIYAILLGLFRKKFNAAVSLVGAMIFGRILYAGVLFVSISMLGFSSYGISVIESVKMGIPGILLQIAFVPVIAKIMNKGLNLKND